MTEPYKKVRALERGLNLLVELNQRGRASPAELAEATGIDRTTVYRMLATLMDNKLVARSPGDDSYYLLSGVRKLSSGFAETDQVLHLATLEMGRLLLRVKWPSDFGTFDQGSILIRETTHRFSAYSVHRDVIGRRRGLMNSALGRAVLAAASPTERGMMLEIAKTSYAPDVIDELVNDFQHRGYAWSVGGTEAHISAIAVPIRGPQFVIGAINIIFFRTSGTPEQIAARHLAALRQCTDAIEVGLTHLPDQPTRGFDRALFMPER